METSPEQNNDRLALVSSFYGPGAVTCWYLTTLAVLTSWTLHPTKRKSGSIDEDIIAVLTFPAVAAGHILWQARKLLSEEDPLATVGRDEKLLYAQRLAAIEAPLNIIEVFMASGSIILVISAWTYSRRRCTVVGLVRVLCIGADFYVHFLDFRKLVLRVDPDVSRDDELEHTRLFIADFAGLSLVILVLLALYNLISAPIALLLTPPFRRGDPPLQRDAERVRGTSIARVSLLFSAIAPNFLIR